MQSSRTRVAVVLMANLLVPQGCTWRDGPEPKPWITEHGAIMTGKDVMPYLRQLVSAFLLSMKPQNENVSQRTKIFFHAPHVKSENSLSFDVRSLSKSLFLQDKRFIEAKSSDEADCSVGFIVNERFLVSFGPDVNYRSATVLSIEIYDGFSGFSKTVRLGKSVSAHGSRVDMIVLPP